MSCSASPTTSVTLCLPAHDGQHRTLPTVFQCPRRRHSMIIEAVLNIAEIPYESSAIRLRHARMAA